jgi:hypothetical protein
LCPNTSFLTFSGFRSARHRQNSLNEKNHPLSQWRAIHQRIMLKATMAIAIPLAHRITLVALKSEVFKGLASIATDAAATHWTPIMTGPITAIP